MSLPQDRATNFYPLLITIIRKTQVFNIEWYVSAIASVFGGLAVAIPPIKGVPVPPEDGAVRTDKVTSLHFAV